VTPSIDVDFRDAMGAVLPVRHPCVSQRLTETVAPATRSTAPLAPYAGRMARWIDSWLPGGGATASRDLAGRHAGERFGLPAEGVNSVAGFGRRLAALSLDWLAAYLIAAVVAGPGALERPTIGWAVLGVWFLLTAVPVAVFGASAGMTALGIRVAPLDGAAVVGVPRALLRTALIAVVVPAVIRDEDGRGLHDRATRTVVVRTRA
jgi:RDD family